MAGIEIPAMQHLLPGPEPEQIVLGLPGPPDFRTENVGRQRDAADQEKQINRRSPRRISQHTKNFPQIRGRSRRRNTRKMEERFYRRSRPPSAPRTKARPTEPPSEPPTFLPRSAT